MREQLTASTDLGSEIQEKAIALEKQARMIPGLEKKIALLLQVAYMHYADI